MPSCGVMLYLGSFLDDKWQFRIKILCDYMVLCGFFFKTSWVRVTTFLQLFLKSCGFLNVILYFCLHELVVKISCRAEL